MQRSESISLPRQHTIDGVMNGAYRDLDAIRANIEAGNPPVIEVTHWVYTIRPGKRMVYFKNNAPSDSQMKQVFIPQNIQEYITYLKSQL